MSSASETLKKQIYPQINAYSLGYLSHLSPMEQDDHIICACPKCSYRASYKPNTSGIKCLSGCNQFTSIWDVLASKGIDNSSIWSQLCQAANYTPQSRRTKPEPDAPKQSRYDNQYRKSLANDKHALLRSVLQNSLFHSEKALAFLKERGWTEELIRKSHLGYVSSISLARDKLMEAGFTPQQLSDYGTLDDPNLEQHIVIPWKHTNGQLKLVGINRTNNNNGFTKQKNFNKSLPKGFSSTKGPTLILDHPLDAALVNARGGAAFATLSLTITREQAVYLSRRKTEYLFLLPGDKASERAIEQSAVLLSSIGVTTRFSTPGKPVNQLSTADIEQLSKDSLSLAQFLSRRMIASNQRTNSMHATVRQLNNKDKQQLKEILLMQHIKLNPDTAEQFRLLANLIDLGAKDNQTVDILKQKFNRDELEHIAKLLSTAAQS